MIEIKRILSPTDFSRASLAALDMACELALHFGSELDVVYVVPSVPTLPAEMNYTFEVPRYEEALKDAAEEKVSELILPRVPSQLAWRPLIAYGDPATEIVRVAAEEKSDWIVISTHGLTGWKHLVFGSVTEKVVRLAECPVLTVRAPRAAAR